MLLNFAIMRNKKETIIRYWLITGLSIIIIMIVIGGITRLTNSGLSMVDWSVFGELSTKENIEKAYYKWQDSPQGNQMNLTLKEFRTRSIYDNSSCLMVFIQPVSWSLPERKRRQQLLSLYCYPFI